jgi:chromosomal replication initiator protein
MAEGVVMVPLVGHPLTCTPSLDTEQDRGIALREFLAGPENRLVDPAVRAVLDQQPSIYNPLVVYGPSGTGKSHLAQGLAAAWKRRFPGQRVVYATAVDFARELADAIQTQAVEDFRHRYRNASLVVFEDLGGLVGKEAAQEELLYTLDAVLREAGQVVVTAKAAPRELADLVPGLQARLSEGLTIPLAPPGPGTRLAILQRLAELREIDLPESLAQLLAEGLCGTVPELFGALTQLEVPARHSRRKIDAESVRKYLAQRNEGPQLQIRDIAVVTARCFSLRLADLRGSSRKRPIVVARGVAMYLSRLATRESLEQVGQYFGGRDHTTVLHACRKTEELLKTDPAVSQAIRELQKKLQGS